ncbi:MAG TPA: PTS fructose transporter subunit IA, partial [Lactobacillus acetotolerans]|nr:PTS fructose transporter subunit IA [Lactobacillus acetotolerans]HBQ42839.1 PTS fructose transporter subunit IA [Lactobacillus acetotolerans]HCX39490.1 PTS fructose transporter subunit IA [Lactobacillus acetotolerans]
FVIGALGMLLFGYGQWRGRKNVNLVIDDYQKKIDHIDKEMKKVKK